MSDRLSLQLLFDPGEYVNDYQIISPSWLNDRGELNTDALLDAFLDFLAFGADGVSASGN
jgi:hypothetical protein